MHEFSVGAIIFNQHKVLLIHQKNGDHIGFPKGHVECQESIEETALREVKEEVGLDVKLIQITFDIYYEPKPDVHKKVTYFLAHTDDTVTYIQNTEIHRAFWVIPDEAIEVLTYQNDKKALTYMIAHITEDAHDYRNG